MNFAGRIVCGLILVFACLPPAEAFNGPLRSSRQETGLYRSLTDLAARYNWKCAAPADGAARLGSDRGWFEFRPGSRTALWNGKLLALNFSALRDADGIWWIHQEDLSGTLLPMLAPELPPQTIRRILLDPGHGGTDPGARGKDLGILEKQINLAVALRVENHLKKAGFEVILTRSGDDTVSLNRRAALATAHNADLFLSIHQNSAENRKASGIETFVTVPENCVSTHQKEIQKTIAPTVGNRFDHHSLLLASEIQRRAVDYTGSVDRGVKRTRFFVVRESDCPSVLIECGFISNKDDEMRMTQPEWQDRISRAIADGICAFSGKEIVQ